MPQVCGIYGFEFTRPFEVLGARFTPIATDYRDAQRNARDPDSYNLTGTVTAGTFADDFLFCLEAILTFIEHLDVVITQPEALSGADMLSQFPSSLRVARRHSGGGAMLASDAIFPKSRPQFIDLAVGRLADSVYCEATGYRILFFKVTEVFRQRRPFLDVSYFLLFSGLETYVRRSLNDHETREIAVLLSRHLIQLGFNVVHFSPSDPQRSTDTYARLRNALFHDSSLEAHRRANGTVRTYKLTDYYAQFLILVALVVLKATGFDDGHTNWNAWIDRQLLK